MSRRIRGILSVPLVLIAAHLLLAVGMVLGLAYFAAESFRRPGMAAYAPAPAVERWVE